MTDHGAGIPQDRLERICEPFYRAGSYQADQGGTGLGLAIVRHLVQLHGGTIQFSSELGKGTMVEFWVPHCPGESTELPIHSPDARAVPAELSVLVVEDNPVNMMLMRRLLDSEGLHGIYCANGEEALENATQPFSVVLMDMSLPGMNGEQCMTALRAERQSAGLSDVPIVALTASVVPDASRHYSNLGFDGFEAKPVEITGFAYRLADYVALHAIKASI